MEGKVGLDGNYFSASIRMECTWKLQCEGSRHGNARNSKTTTNTTWKQIFINFPKCNFSVCFWRRNFIIILKQINLHIWMIFYVRRPLRSKGRPREDIKQYFDHYCNQQRNCFNIRAVCATAPAPAHSRQTFSIFPSSISVSMYRHVHPIREHPN